MALTAAQLVAVRHYCGYSVTGDATAAPARTPVYSNDTYLGLSLDYRLAHLTAEEEAKITGFFLPHLAAREEEIQGAASNLDTKRAAVWERNEREVSDRIGLFWQLRRDLCAFLGFAPGPGVGGGNRLVRA